VCSSVGQVAFALAWDKDRWVSHPQGAEVSLSDWHLARLCCIVPEHLLTAPAMVKGEEREKA